MAEQRNHYRVVCPSCGHSEEMEFLAGLNAGRFPEFRRQVLDTSYGRIDCGQCETRFYVEAPFFYTDSLRGEWFACYPPQWEASWQQFVGEAEELADSTFDPKNLPPVLKNMREETKIRVVFGIQALREKLICGSAELDDVALEIFKLGMIQSSEKLAPLLSHRPRCIAIGDEGLQFVIRSTGEAQFTTIPHEEYARVINREEWAPIYAMLSDSPYVDLGKLFHSGADRVEPANA